MITPGLHPKPAVQGPVPEPVAQAREVRPEVPPHCLGVVQLAEPDAASPIDLDPDLVEAGAEIRLLELVRLNHRIVQCPDQRLLRLEHVVGGRPLEECRREQEGSAAAGEPGDECGDLAASLGMSREGPTEPLCEGRTGIRLVPRLPHEHCQIRDVLHAAAIKDVEQLRPHRLGERMIRLVCREVPVEYRRAVRASDPSQQVGELGVEVLPPLRKDDDEGRVSSGAGR